MSPPACARRAAASILFAVALVGCDGKLIRLGPGTPNADGSAPDRMDDASGADSGDAGPAIDAPSGDGSTSCLHGTVAANEVLWIGDSWVLMPGLQHMAVRDMAIAAGAIGPSEDYLIAAAAGASMSVIANQYLTQESTATKVKVLIMDGGTWDTIISGGTTDSVNSAAAAFGQLLSRVAADGTVQHIIYFLMPELANIPGVATLRPLFMSACDQSTVPCHFIDLQPLWSPQYTAAGDTFPNNAGAQVLANAIWKMMTDECIAQ